MGHVRRAGVCADRDRRIAIVPHAADRLFQCNRRNTEMPVRRNLDDALAANSNDTRCALDRGVRLVAHEYRRSIRRTSLLARRDERIQDCGRPAGREKTACGSGIADPIAEPVDYYEFELARAAGPKPGSLEDIEARCEVVGDDAGPGRCGRHEGKKARVVDTGGVREHVGYGALENRQRILS